MKKHLIAAAVAAAVAVPATAQVTVSGVLDLGFGNAEVTHGTTSRKTQNTGIGNRSTTSQIVFSATEDLGGGLKAAAFHSMQINATGTTDATFQPRDSWLSISGGFGAVQLGRFTPAFETNAGKYSVTGTVNSAGTADFMFGTNAAAAAAAAAGTAGPVVQYIDIGRGINTTAVAGGSPSNTNSGQTLQYTLPKFGPVSVVAGYGRQVSNFNGATNKDETSQMDLSVDYSAGPFSVGFAMVDRKGKSNGVAGESDIELQSIGASYNAGVALLKVGRITRDQQLAVGTAKEVEATLNSVGISVPMGATTLYANMLDGKDKAGAVAANVRDLSGYQVGALYALSKRTTAYVIIGENEYKGNSEANTSSVENATIGMRHSF